MPMPSVALLIGAVRSYAATAGGAALGGSVCGTGGRTPVRGATLPAYCRRAHRLTIIGCRRRRDANADGGGANGHCGDDSGDPLHGLISNLATAPTISSRWGKCHSRRSGG